MLDVYTDRYRLAEGNGEAERYWSSLSDLGSPGAIRGKGGVSKTENGRYLSV
jgi:hypothetical protein